MIKLYNYEAVPQTRAFDTYNDVDCWMHSHLHDFIKWAKWGYGRTTDHAVRELRFGRLSREQAARLAAQYERREPTHLEHFLEWLGMTRSGFEFILERHRSKKIWWGKVGRNN